MITPVWNGTSWELDGRRMIVAEMRHWWDRATPLARDAAARANARNQPAAPRPAGGRAAEPRRRAKRLLADERTARLRAQRTKAQRRRASALMHADDWHVYFRARRKLIHAEDERCRMGFELFGDPGAFGRHH
ncbi:MAG TPA: hypothetical protein VNU19_00520 [Candidatus Acidoferrum sp.]|jgi:hypothetical protein|nr:hypothetical protein [Candidatus Acidoferrum sp.]